jgi:hypothetical protein
MGPPVRIQPQVLVELCEYRKATVSGLISTDKFRFAAAAKGEGGPIQLRIAAFLSSNRAPSTTSITQGISGYRFSGSW